MANNNINSQELNEEKRKRKVAIIKASNQMLKDAKETALKHNSDPIKRAELEERFNTAIEENNAMAKNFLHATLEEVENSTYREVDPAEVEKYNRRLEKKGITDEQLQRKESASVTVGKQDKTNGIPRRRRRSAKKDESEIVRLDNEEELMKLTMVTDDRKIQEHIEKNKQFENQMFREGKDIIKKMEKAIEDEKASQKINPERASHMDRVEIETKQEEKTQKMVKKEEKIQKTEAITPSKKEKVDEDVVTYDFDFSNIPNYVQYDVIPLPSNGQCYSKTSPLRCGRIPVAYLTASDENIIASPNVYRDGKLLDIIIERKVLDKRINVKDLCSGDRDAIILWLRGTSYGENFPISVRHPETGKQYDIDINLSQFNYNKFTLKSDENGLFEYKTNNGDSIKFKFFTNEDEEILRKKITSQITDSNKFDILKNLNFIDESMNNISFTEEETNMIREDIDEIKEIVGADMGEYTEEIYPNTITEQMILHTVSVNDNEDRDFIRNYIENMRTKAALDYRNYFINNKPGVDFNFTVNVPESDGGGSFDTFLRIDDTIFINF